VDKTGLTVTGLRELQKAFKAAGPIANKELKATLREVAEPIRSDAESLAVAGIPRIGLQWARMRTGVTQRAVYVAPRQRGVKSATDPRRRPRFADLLEQRAMHPALEQNKPLIEGRVEDAFNVLAERWNRSG
jgi:hypothetical protein